MKYLAQAALTALMLLGIAAVVGGVLAGVFYRPVWAYHLLLGGAVAFVVIVITSMLWLVAGDLLEAWRTRDQRHG